MFIRLTSKFSQNGPTHFVQTSTINPDSPKIQTSNVHNHVENPNIPIDFSQQNRRFTLDAQNVTNADAGSIQTSSTTTRDDMRPSGIRIVFTFIFID